MVYLIVDGLLLRRLEFMDNKTEDDIIYKVLGVHTMEAYEMVEEPPNDYQEMERYRPLFRVTEAQYYELLRNNQLVNDIISNQVKPVCTIYHTYDLNRSRGGARYKRMHLQKW